MVLLEASISLPQNPRIPLNVLSAVAPSNYLQLISSGTLWASPGSDAALVGADGGAFPPMNSGPPEPALGFDDIVYRAKALYACTLPSGTFWTHCLHGYTDTGSVDDPNEISFAKNELLDILDKQGKWWQVRKFDGTVGSKYPFAAEALDPIEHHVPSCSFKLPPNYFLWNS